MKSAALELKLFEMLKPLPLASVTSLLGMILVIVFFVTSSDSGSLVIDTITAGGKASLTALQAMAVSTGFPFTVVLLLMCVSLFIGLMKAYRSR